MEKRHGQGTAPVPARPLGYSRRTTCCIEKFRSAARAARVEWQLPTGWAEFDDALQLVDATDSARVRGGVCRLVAQFLHARLAEDQPCSWLGRGTLLLVNPRPALCIQYSAEAIAAHQQLAAFGLAPPPHIYSVAQAAVDGAVAALLQLEPEKAPVAVAVAGEAALAVAGASGGRSQLDHVICCVGDAGSGKTEAARAALGYLAQVSVSRRQPPLPTRERAFCIEHKLIAANEIVDAFGRARLNQSPHSSRLGRTLQVRYNEHGCVVSANLDTYCLESSRVARPQKLAGSNFTVFYLLCDGAKTSVQVDLKLVQDGLSSASPMRTSFTLLSQETCMVPADMRSSHAEDFNGLQQALLAMGVDTKEQRNIWDVLAAILFLGNLEVDVVGETGTSEDGSSACTVAQTPAAEHASELLHIMGNPWDDGQLFHALSTVTRPHGSEEISHCMDAPGILRNRDKLVVALYDGLFGWLTKRLNDELNGRDGRAQSASSPPSRQPVQPATATASVWLMDTLGFDSAASASGNYGAVNFGFDQFCATYAAEKLHYHYVRHSFHEEESAYRADGVELRGCSWSVDSNDDLLDLLDRSSSDSKPVSLLATLQVVTEQPSGTESTFRARLEEQLPQHARWARHAGSASGFVVRHFGQRVSTMAITYDAMDFVESNRIDLPQGIKDALQTSGWLWIGKLVNSSSGAKPASEQLSHTGGAEFAVATRSVRMQSEISRLCDVVDKSSCHFVRCLVAANGVDTSLVESQLQRANTEELVTTRIQGYAERLAFDVALRRWKAVRPRSSTVGDKLEATQELMDILRMPSLWHIPPNSNAVYLKARAVRLLDCLCAIALLIPYAKGCYARRQFKCDIACVKQLQRRITARSAVAERVTARFFSLCADPDGAVVGECYQCFQMWFAWRGVDPVAMLEMQKLTNTLLAQSREKLNALRLDNDFVSIQRTLEECKRARKAMPDEYAALVKHRDAIMNSVYQQMQNALSSRESSSVVSAFGALNLFRGIRDFISEPNVYVYEALQKRLRRQRDIDEAEITKYLQTVSDDTWDDVRMSKYEQLSRAYYENGMGLRSVHESIRARQAAHWKTAHQQVQSVLLSTDHTEVSLTLERLRGYQHREFADDIYHLRQRLEVLLRAGPTQLVMQAALESGDPTTMAVALGVYELSNESVQAMLQELVLELQRTLEKSQLLAEIAVLKDTNDANRIREELAIYDQALADLAAEEREDLRQYANSIVTSVREELISAQSSDDQKTVSSALLAGEKYKQDEQIVAPFNALQAHYESMLREANEHIGAAIDSESIHEMNAALFRYEGWGDLKLENLRLSRESQLQIIEKTIAEMVSSRDFYTIRNVLEQHRDYKDQLKPAWDNLNGRYTELVDEYRAHCMSIIVEAGSEVASAADLNSALVDSCDPTVIALATQLDKQHKVALAEADEVISELEVWLDETRHENERVQSEYEGNMTNMVLKKVAMQVQHRALREWRQFAAERARFRRIVAKLGLSTQHGNLSVNFGAWRAYATEAARAKTTVQLARRKMTKVWLRASWAKLRRCCSTRRYARLQAENARAEKQTLLCQTEMARLHALQMSRSVRQHKRTCFNAWCWRTQKHYRANRSVLSERATKRNKQWQVRLIWRSWCRVIEIESWYRAQMEAEKCIAEVDERCKSTIDTVRIKAVFAIRGRVSTLRSYFLLWHVDVSARAREHQGVQLKLSQIEFRQSQLRSLFNCWLDGVHTARLVKKHHSLLHKERMRSAQLKMRSQSMHGRFAERRRNTDRLLTVLTLWMEYYRATKRKEHAVVVSLQRLARSAACSAWEMWCEAVGQSRRLRRVTIRIKFLALKNAFAAWGLMKEVVADDAAASHLQKVRAEAAFGRHTQAQVRFAFSAWGVSTVNRRKSKQIMLRIVHKREYAAKNDVFAQWVDSTRIKQRERKERRVIQELEARQVALDEAQALIDRSEMGHLLSPRLVMLRRAFNLWKATWQENHEYSLILVRKWRVQINRTLRAAFSAWWKTITSLESLSAAQLAAQGKALLLYGNGPALARWFHNRCDSVTKRISSELTQLVTDSQLYQQAIDIGGEWQVDVSESQELTGRFWLRTVPVEKTALPQQTPRKGNHLLGTSPSAYRSPTARLGNPYVYAVSQTRGKSKDFLDDYAQMEVAAAVRRADGAKRPGSRSRSRSTPSVADGTPEPCLASPSPQLSLEDNGDSTRNCCVFELRMK